MSEIDPTLLQRRRDYGTRGFDSGTQIIVADLAVFFLIMIVLAPLGRYLATLP